MATQLAIAPAASSHRRWMLPVLYALFGSLAFAVLAFNIFRPVVVLPRITLAPGFALTNQLGNTVTSEDRRGKISLYSFSAVDCPAPECPQSITDIRQAWDSLQTGLPATINFDLITIALDGSRQMPASLPPPHQNSFNWHWLTGEPYLIKSIVGGGFDMYFQLQPDQSVAFEPRYVLVDGGGVVRALYFDRVPDAEILLRDVNYLIKEAENSDGTLRLAYEAAHLFSCYPR